MNPWIAVTSLFLLLLVSNAASAQTPADDIRGRVKERQEVVITDAQGRELKGRVIQMTDSLLTVQQKGDTVDVHYSDIIAIDRPKDRLVNGALFGLAVGAAVGVVLGSSDASPESASPFCGMGYFDDCGQHSVAVSVIASSIAGTLIGASVDAVIRHDQQIYRRSGTRLIVSPTFSRGGAGALVAVSW
jgi:hypothetical protein